MKALDSDNQVSNDEYAVVLGTVVEHCNVGDWGGHGRGVDGGFTMWDEFPHSALLWGLWHSGRCWT
jgi:hypothetical protein